MRVKVIRKDGKPIMGRKKSLTFTISKDLKELSKSSEKYFYTDDIDEYTWSVYYQTDDMRKYNCLIEMLFNKEDFKRTLEPCKMYCWEGLDIIGEDEFTATII